ncbi:MAG: protease inhibitor I42 family protein [Acutalibacteraceae bacterium]
MFSKIFSLFLSFIMLITSLFGGGADKDKSDIISYNLSKTTVSVTISENPSTGYQWSYNIINEKVAYLSADRYVNTAPEGVSGAAGTRILTFRGIEEGTTKIVLSYERPFEEESEPIRVITLILTVNSDKTLEASVFSDTGNIQ